MKTKAFNGLMLILFAFLNGCEKESSLAEITYPIKYSFYNDGDTKLQKVVVYCTTVYPKEKLTSWQSTGKWREPFDYDKQYLLHDFDSILIDSDMKAYTNCIYVFDVSLHFLDGKGTGHVKIYSKTDTIHKQADASVKFRWPSDTLFFTRLN